MEIRRSQEGEGHKAPHPGGHRGLRAQGARPQREDVLDHEGIKTLLHGADTLFPRLSHLWVDAGYRGQDKGKEWVEKTLGWSAQLVERPRNPASKEVLMAWAQQWNKEGVER